MNTTEDRLREALDSAAETVRQDDLRPLVAPTKTSPRRGFIALAAATAGVVALTLAAIQFWPPAVDEAVAAWSATPKVNSVLAERAGAHCAKDLGSGIDPVPGEPRWQPMVVDLRGHDARVVAVGRKQFALCTYRGLGISHGEIDGLNALSMTGSASEIPSGKLPAAGVSIEAVDRFMGKYWGAAVPVGQVGTSVQRVMIALDDGTEMQATTENGWYVAWWPEELQTPDDPVSVIEKKIVAIRAYDASGKLVNELRPEAIPSRR